MATFLSYLLQVHEGQEQSLDNLRTITMRKRSSMNCVEAYSRSTPGG